MDTETNLKHARSWRQACTMRRFLMTTDAELALASSWQRMMTRDKLSVCRHEQSQRLKPRVRKPENTVRVAGPEPQSVPRPVEEQPVPTVRVGGSSGSGTRSGVGSRASEKTQMIVKRNVSESQRVEARRGKAKMSRNWQRKRKNNTSMPMSRCLRTIHGG